MNVSAVSFGAWAIGGFWGAVDDDESMQALHAAVDSGVNFIDTADVYGDGRSERLVARLRRERPGETIWVATKAGRRLDRQTVEGYSRENLTAWIDRSLTNLETDAIDLLQLHCPPVGVYDRPEIFGVLDDLVAAGKLRYYGVSVETVDEAERALQYSAVQSVQIIFNLFRPRPAETFFQHAAGRQVGILARVPLASGLLTGKLTRDSTFTTSLGFGMAAMANTIGRRHLARFMDRTIFHDPREHPAFFRTGSRFDAFHTHEVALGRGNLAEALLATASIPLVLQGVPDIPSAPRGV